MWFKEKINIINVKCCRILHGRFSNNIFFNQSLKILILNFQIELNFQEKYALEK